MAVTLMPVVVSGCAIAVYGRAHLGYDAGWSLLWGKQIAAGGLPDFEAAGAPTPHPLVNVVAAIVAPLDDAAGGVLAALSVLLFGVLVAAVYRLGSRLFGPLAGALAAVIVFTRPALVNGQAQALTDIPFMACITMAAALEAERPRRGGAVLLLLTCGGLLRPEGWLFTAAYVLYLLPGRRWRDKLRLMALGAVAPCVWATFDMVVTGDPLYSLHGTRQLAVELDRPRTLGAALHTSPQALADFLGRPLSLAGLAGLVVAVLLIYRRALLPVALIALGLVSFMALGLAGLPVLTRYLIVPVIMLGVFAAAGLAGWRLLDAGGWQRRCWMAGSAVAASLLLLSVPADVRNDRNLVAFLAQRGGIERDLQALTNAPVWDRLARRPLHVTTRRAVPLLAFWLDLPVRDISAAPPRAGARVLLVRHTTPTVAANFYSLTTPAWSQAPDPTVTWRELYRNASWGLYESTPVRRRVASAIRPRTRRSRSASRARAS